MKSLIIGADEQEKAAIAEVVDGNGASVVFENNGARMFERIRVGGFDVIFARTNVPGFNGARLIDMVKELSPETELFVVVQPDNLEEGVEFLKMGAEGFLVKDGLADQVQVMVKRVGKRKQLKRLAYTDGLTSLFNYSMFQHFLLQECRRCSRHRRTFALLVMDIDDFKTYNDMNGHLLGDIALIKIGKLLKEHSRSSDIPARCGGDEFGVILTEINPREAFLRAKQFQQLVALSRFQFEKNMPGEKLTISIGVALYPEHGANNFELIKSADTALYRAKAAGRNRVCLYKRKSQSEPSAIGSGE